MKYLKSVSLLLAGGMAVALAPPPAQASRTVEPQVVGHVTSVGSNTAIVVEGRRYLVAVNSAAYKALGDVKVGDSVGLILNGPPTNSASHVTALVTKQARAFTPPPGVKLGPFPGAKPNAK
jgi:hypothetical protein